MAYEIQVSKNAAKQIERTPFPWKDRIRRAIDLLALDPFIGNKMRGEYKAQRKIRIWPYRIYYCVFQKEKIIFVLSVKHRGDVEYK